PGAVGSDGGRVELGIADVQRVGSGDDAGIVDGPGLRGVGQPQAQVVAGPAVEEAEMTTVGRPDRRSAHIDRATEGTEVEAATCAAGELDDGERCSGLTRVTLALRDDGRCALAVAGDRGQAGAVLGDGEAARLPGDRGDGQGGQRGGSSGTVQA